MYNILIVDISIYKDSIAKIFLSKGCNVEVCGSAFDAMAKLKAYDFDLIVSEIELPGDNAFDLYNYINKNYPYIPMIMTTDKNIDNFFNNIFQEGIGNILCKPIKKDELLNLSEKLITKKNIFGLSNYIKDISETKKIRITNSKQIPKAIPLIIGEIEKWGFRIEDKMAFNLILSEMAINAVYHSHGLTKEKIKRESVQLKEGDHVDIFFGKGKDSYGIAIDDYNGNLTKLRILESINNVIEQDHILENADGTPEDISALISETGRGIDFLRKLTGQFYFIIKKDIRTEIIIIFDRHFFEDDLHNYSSLKIIEDVQTE